MNEDVLKIAEKCVLKSLNNNNLNEIFTYVLEQIRILISFDYAFFAEVKVDDNKNKFYRYHSFFGFDKLDGNSIIKKYFYNKINSNGNYFDFTNMEAIHGRLLDDDIEHIEMNNVIKTRGKPLPKGHPPIDGFRSFKLKNDENDILGVLGFGNCKGTIFSHGFNEIVSKLLPFLTSILSNIQEKNAISKHKDIFLSNMSHEIRTPLHGIVSLTKLLAKSELNAEQTEYVNIISQCSIQLSDIVNDILDYAKINVGKMKFINEPVELIKNIENARDLVLIKQNSTNIPVNITVNGNVPKFVVSDKTRMCQVLVNILGNAYKFTSKGHISLNVELIDCDETKNECELKFTVHDTGIGIPANKLETIFESFQQLTNNIFENNSGVGLGLPISKHIINKMGGNIWVESEVGVGSTVHFTIKCGLYHNRVDFDELGKFFGGKNFIIIDNDTIDKTIIFNSLSKIDAKPIMCLNVSDAILYINSGVFVVEYIIVNIDNVSEVEIMEINGIKSNITKIVLVSSEMKDKLKLVKHHYDLIKPITVDKVYNICDKIRRGDSCSELESNNGNSSGIMNGSGDIDGRTFRSNIINKVCVENEKKYGAVGEVVNGVNSNGLNILVTEDNENNKIVMTKLLQSIGYYNISYASHGIEMVDMIKKNRYDLVFVDLKMPFMDGITATREVIKNSTDGSKLPMLVALTASISDDTKEMCFDVGMKAFLSKPIEMDDLETVMTIALKNKTSSIY